MKKDEIKSIIDVVADKSSFIGKFLRKELIFTLFCRIALMLRSFLKAVVTWNFFLNLRISRLSSTSGILTWESMRLRLRSKLSQ